MILIGSQHCSWMLTEIHTKGVISSRRLILVAEVGSNGVEARVSGKCTLFVGSEPQQVQ